MDSGAWQSLESSGQRLGKQQHAKQRNTVAQTESEPAGACAANQLAHPKRA